jgi:hypothetical protein
MMPVNTTAPSHLFDTNLQKKNLISTCMQEAGEGEYNRPEKPFLNPCEQIAVGSAGHHRKLWKILGKRGALTTRGGKT